MRAWQERYTVVSSAKAYWPANKKGVAAGAYPENGFYRDDVSDEDFAASLVEALYYEIMTGDQIFIKGSPEADLDYEDFYSVPDYPVIDRTNYVSVFTALVQYMHGLGTARVGVSHHRDSNMFGEGIERQEYPDDIRLDVIEEATSSLAEVPDPYSAASPSGTTATSDELEKYGAPGVHLIQYLGFNDDSFEDIPADGEGYWHALIWRHTGRPVVNTTGMIGTVTLYSRAEESIIQYDRLYRPNRVPTSTAVKLSEETNEFSAFQQVDAFAAGQMHTGEPVGPAVELAQDFTLDVEGLSETDGVASAERRIIWEFHAFLTPSFKRWVDELFIPLDCSCVSCMPGETHTENACVRVEMNLGGGSRGHAGELVLDEEVATNALSTPALLKLRTNGEAVPVYTSGGTGDRVIRQVVAPNVFVDVNPVDAFSYKIDFYKKSNQGAMTAGGVYDVTGSPYRTVTISNPDMASPLTKLRVLVSAGSSIVSQTDYVWNSADSTWLMVKAGGDSQHTVDRIAEASPGPGLRRETVIETDEDDNILSKRTLTFKVFAWNTGSNAINPEELVEETIDPDGDALTTSYQYYETTDEETGAYEGRLKLRVEPSSYWEKHEYYQGGLTERITSPWGNTAVGETDRLRYRHYDRTAADPQYTRYEEGLIDSTGQHTTKREHRIDDYDQTVVQHSLDESADRDDPENLIAIQSYYNEGYLDGEFAGKIFRDVQPDGTGRVFVYRRVTEGVETTLYSGALQPAYKALARPGYPSGGLISSDNTVLSLGTKTVFITNGSGEKIEESIYDVPSASLLSFSIAGETDDFGRVTLREFDDDTSEQYQFGCCNLEYSVDREGIRTDYAYDDFGQLESSKRAEVTTKSYTEFVDGNPNEVTVRIGSDLTEMEQSRVVRNLAGRVLSITTQGRTTLFNEEILPSGETVKTTTYPDLATRIETYGLDGKLSEIAGTAVAHVKYEEAVSSSYWFGSHYLREIKVGDGGEETQWVMTFPDLLGRPLYTVRPDAYRGPGHYDYIDYSYVRSLGAKLRHVSDEDGFQTLYSYDDLGELTEQASDLDWSFEIEPGGIDRITRTTRSLTTRANGTPVRRTTVKVWPEDGADSPVQLSQTDISLDGRTIWRTEAGVDSMTVIVLGPAAGARTETSTHADNTSLVRVFLNGRLQSETHRDSAGQTATSFTYGYDPHGRMETVTDALGRTTTTDYHPGTDLVHTITTPDPDTAPEKTGAGYDAQTTTYTYDDAGRVWKVEQHDGAITETTYWGNGKVKRVSGGRVYPQAYTYDSQGRVKTLTTWRDFAGDSDKATTTWNYNPQRGWLDSKLDDDSQGPVYTYWASGRLGTREWVRTHNSAPLVATYDYNDAGDLMEIVYSDDTPAVSHTYDRLGRPLTTTDAAGLLTRSYDPASFRLSGEAYTGAGVLSGRGIARTYDLKHRPQSLATDGGYGLGYSYDKAGRLEIINQGFHSAHFGYEAGTSLHKRTTVKRVGVERVRHDRNFDRIGRIESVTSTVGGIATVARTYGYNDANQRVGVAHENGRRWAYDYDDLGQVRSAQKRLADNTTPLPGYTFGYAFDDIGNRTETTANGRTATYNPDLLNRYFDRVVPGAFDVRGEANIDSSILVTVDTLSTIRTGRDFYRELAAPNGSAAVRHEIEIEATRISPPESVGETRSAFLPQTPEEFKHDDDGNLEQDGRWDYEWDAENRLVGMETRASIAIAFPELKKRLTFVYDAQGRRIRKTVESWDVSLNTGAGGWVETLDLLFLYDGWNLLTELDANNSNALVRSHAWGLDLSGSTQGAGGVGGLLWTSTPTHSFAACADGNGNIVAWINTATLAVSGRADYGAFGEVVQSTGVANTLPFGFSTKYTDKETGLLCYGFRYYNPSTGRWLSRDPIQERGGLNLYGMVQNDAVNRWDYLGLMEKLKLAYDLANDTAVWDRPFNAKKVTSWQAILDDVKKQVKENCCISELTIGAHGSRGAITASENGDSSNEQGVRLTMMSFTMVKKNFKETPNNVNEMNNVRTLKEIATYMCPESKLHLVICLIFQDKDFEREFDNLFDQVVGYDQKVYWSITGGVTTQAEKDAINEADRNRFPPGSIF